MAIIGKPTATYEQTTTLSAIFKTKKACQAWLREQFEDGFDVYTEPRRHLNGGWYGGADKRETIEVY